MALLERLRCPTKGAGARGEFDSAEDREHLVSKEGSDTSLEDQHRTLLASYRRLKLWFRGLSVALAIACIALAIGMFHTGKASIQKKVLSPIPEMPTTLVTFEQNDTFAGPSTPENDQAWSAMMPGGDGFLTIANPEAYNLPPGKSSKHGDVYDTSMFHQLHCLAHIRNHYYLTAESLHSNNSQAIQEKLLRPQEDHVHHCFDYLRQGIMCMGDLTVEWPRTEEDGRRFAVDGWGITHVCKDWDAIMKFMNENDVSSKIWT